jgi:hypothetical protein
VKLKLIIQVLDGGLIVVESARLNVILADLVAQKLRREVVF